MENLFSFLPYESDVCLAYFGEDKCNSFTQNLGKALSDRRIRTFIIEDEESILKAIQKSRTAIIIFPENVGISSSCLSELYVIGMHTFLFPVFINTSPSQVTKTASDCYDPYDSDGQTYPFELDFYERWIRILSKVAKLPGWYFKDGKGMNLSLSTRLLKMSTGCLKVFLLYTLQ